MIPIKGCGLGDDDAGDATCSERLEQTYHLRAFQYNNEQTEKVAFKAEKSMIGKFVMVKIDELNGHTYKGTLQR